MARTDAAACRSSGARTQSRGAMAVVPRYSLAALCVQAARALWRNKGRSGLTSLGIAIGIASVVWVVAIGRAGAERAESLLSDLGDNLVWVEAGSRNVNGARSGTRGTTTLTIGDAEAIRREVPLVTRVSPQVDGSVLTAFGNRNWTTRYRGISLDYLPIKKWQVAEGAPFTDDDVEAARNVCLIGETVRARLFDQENPIGQVIRLGALPFEVVGVLAPKGQSGTGQDQDDTLMLPYTTVVRKMRPPGATWLDDILCSASAPETVATAAAQVTDLMRQRHRIGADDDDDFNIRHPEEVIQAQLAASRAFAALLVSVASVSLLVGGIGIMNVMLASVTERTREIGVRLAVGATESAIQLQFLAEAVFLCMFGGTCGVVLSLVGSSALSGILGWPLAIPVQAFTYAAGFSVAVGVVFGFLPARRAARMDPIEALRSE
jgi:putative ABC transport system permease protein